jgi:hypothetical protein
MYIYIYIYIYTYIYIYIQETSCGEEEEAAARKSAWGGGVDSSRGAWRKGNGSEKALGRV